MHARRMSLTLLGLTCLLACPASSLGGTPWNRELEALAAWPEANGVRVYAAWTANTESTAITQNLSTRVDLFVNGSLRATKEHEVFLLAGSGSGCSTAPCTGTCGQWVLDGAQGPLLCYKDGPCSPSFCECDCGNWVLTDLGVHSLVPGDDISILLRPGAGGLQDGDTSDDFIQDGFKGQPIGWDRRVDTIALVEIDRGIFDVRALGGVEWNVPSPFFSLDLIVELRIDGVLSGVLSVPVDVENETDPRCDAGRCSAPCGSVNGVPRVCDRTTRWECACSGSWLATFEDMRIDVGADIEVRIRSGPGAMPSLPDTDNDDVVLVPCCEIVGVEAVGMPSVSLRANRPNPFAVSTTIDFVLAEPGLVSLSIVDAAGRRIATILDRTFASGNGSITWEGRDDADADVPAGVYFCTLTTAKGSETRRMTVLR